jgi:hypothetical protein
MAALPNAIADAAVLFAGTNVDALAVLAGGTGRARGHDRGIRRRRRGLVPAGVFWKTGAFSRVQ